MLYDFAVARPPAAQVFVKVIMSVEEVPNSTYTKIISLILFIFVEPMA